MSNVVAIEFDCDFFKESEDNCYQWLKQSDYSDLARIKGFYLRRNGNAKILTYERKRPVFQWSQGLWSHEAIELKKPIPYVTIALARKPRFALADYPPKLLSTIAHEKLKEDNHQARLTMQRAIREKKKRDAPPKPPKVKKPRARQGVKDGTKPVRRSKRHQDKLVDLGDHAIKLDPVYPSGTPPTN
jgi:hypothetical protein